MKVIIDIPKELYRTLQEAMKNHMESLIGKIILNSTPIPDHMTNGDMIKTMFDTVEEHFYDNDRMVDVYGLDRTDDPLTFYADWWNAPYQKGDSVEN